MGFSIKKITRSLGSVFKPVAKVLPIVGTVAGATIGGPGGAAAGSAIGRYLGGRIEGKEHGADSLMGAGKWAAGSYLGANLLGSLGGSTGGGGGSLSSIFGGGGGGGGFLSNIMPTATGTGGGIGGGGGVLGTLNQFLPYANLASNFITGQRTAKAAKTAAEYADPFRDQRAQYQAQLSALYANPSSITNEPGYQFELEQGTNAIDRALASQGRYFSGARPYELTKFAQGLAQTRFQDAVNRLSNLAGAQFTPGGGTTAMYTAAKDTGSNINKLIGDLTLLTGRPSPQLDAVAGTSPVGSIPSYTLGGGNMGYPSALDARYM